MPPDRHGSLLITLNVTPVNDAPVGASKTLATLDVISGGRIDMAVGLGRTPDEYAWTLGRARAWWSDYRAPQPAPNVPSAEVQVIMPGASAFAPTITRQRS